MNTLRFTLVVVMTILSATLVLADVPPFINFQGTLTDTSGNPAPGIPNIIVSIYDQETLGTELWTETHPSVELVNGSFQLTLGSVNPLSSSIFTGEIRWLEINVAGETLSPRTRMVSTPYGFLTMYADTSEYSRTGFLSVYADTSEYTRTAAPDSDWTFSGDNIYRLTGDVGIGTDNPTAKLHVTDNSSGNYGLLGSASYGVYGRNSSSNSYGYLGGTGFGAYGIHGSTNNVGYLGSSNYGVYGQHQYSNNVGYLGSTNYGAYGRYQNYGNFGYLGSSTYGVYGKYIYGSEGYIGSSTYGVYGTHFSSGNWGYIGSVNYGVYGRHNSTGNFGCLGDSSYGVRGAHTASSNVGYLGSSNYGASGTHNISGNNGYFGSSNYGAYGTHVSSGNWGNLGDANYGVYGRHHTTGNYGALGDSSYGVKGRHQLSANLGYLAGSYYGAYGTHNSSGNWGYLGSSTYGTYGEHYSSGNHGYLGGPVMATYGESEIENGYGGYFYAGENGGIGLYARGGTGGCAAKFRGNVIILGATSGDTILELGEGLDYAEEFDVSQKDGITPGSVLIIDPDNPGKLTVSHKAYDSRVAGIVAGAKGLGSGVRLGTGQSDHDVALAGRVYCNVDASETDIEPGDLLTTSSLPGYAMKVTDYARTQGAILGKAMERLEKGQKGQILVLVTLQ